MSAVGQAHCRTSTLQMWCTAKTIWTVHKETLAEFLWSNFGHRFGRGGAVELAAHFGTTP